MLAVSGAAGAQQAESGPAGQRQPVRQQMPTLLLTQLDPRVLAADLDNHAFSLTFAQPVPIKELLLLLVRGTNLSVIPDPNVDGSFVGDLKNVTVRQALDLVLPPLGLDFSVDGAVVHVFRRQQETRLFDISYIAAERKGEATVGGGAAETFTRVSTTTDGDLYADVTKGVQGLVSDTATFNVDRKAGLLQVTDFPERIDRVARYIEAVTDRLHRQVQIDARVLEIELDADHASGLDWTPLSRIRDSAKLLAALATQGKVSVLANPRLLALNNEPAIVRAVTASGGGKDPRQIENVTISVTAHIAEDGGVILSVTPMVSSEGRVPGESATREAQTLARLADGESIVFGGFPRARESRERRYAGAKGGWFGRSTVSTKQRIELVVLLTPRIVGWGSSE